MDKASAISLPMLDPSSSQATPPLGSSPRTPTSDIPDVRSAGSSSPGQSTWKERHDQGRGTVVKEGDVGDGSVQLFPISF